MRFLSRRKFLRTAALATAGVIAGARVGRAAEPKKISVGAHLWVYASKYPPVWDCTPVLEQVFADLRYANVDGVEVMHTNLFHADAVKRLGDLAEKHHLPVIGSSYSAAMWNREQHHQIEDECGRLLEKLRQLKARTFGITVGHAGHQKSADELDAQAEILKKIRRQCQEHGLAPNLHNHAYEVADGMHDLQGTLQRIPDFPLGPDLNWLIRGGVDPAAFIRRFGQQIVYLHIRDQYRNGEWSEAVGEGDTDFVSINTALQEVQFDGIATLELAFPKNFTPTRELKESWKMSRAFVQKTFGW